MRALRALLLYAVLTVLLTFPMAFRLRILDAGDSAFFAWVMAWEIHALRTDPTRLPHANIYHPAEYALGFDEPVLGTTMLALPMSLFTDDAVLVFNVVRLMTFALSGLAVYLLARGLDVGEGPALFAGAAFAFSPIRTDQIAHLNVLGTQWLPFLLLFVFRFFRTGRWGDAFLAALFYVLSALSSGYAGLIALLVLPATIIPLVWSRWRRLARGMSAALVAGLALVPLYLLHRVAMAPHGFGRGDQETVLYAASIESFLAAGAANRLYGDVTAPFRGAANNLFPGLVVPFLVLLGAIRMWRGGRRPSREVLALGILVIAATLVALGPEVRLFGQTLMPGPYALVRDTIPFFEKIRVTSRAGIFIALALAILAARSLSHWRARRGPVVLASVLVLLEGLMAPVDLPVWMRVVDTRQPPPAVYAWLAQQPGDFAIVELPILEPRAVYQRPAFHESTYMVHSTRHWKRLVNGYAGVEPAHYRRIRTLAREFPSEDLLVALRDGGVRYLVLHRGGYGPNQWGRIERNVPHFASSLKTAAAFGDDVVFEVGGP